MLNAGGCDNDLMKDEKVNPEELRDEQTLQQDQSIFLQQYEDGMNPIYQLIVFMQNKRVIAHKELLVLMGCLEKLASTFFFTWEDSSRDADTENLEDHQMNICVSEPGFEFLGNSEHVLKYKSMDQQSAHNAIRPCHRICFR